MNMTTGKKPGGLSNQRIRTLIEDSCIELLPHPEDWLEQGIKRLDKFHVDYPHNVIVFDPLGYLHYLRAIKLGNGKRVAEALVEVEKVLIYNSNLEKGQETAEQLTEMMQTLEFIM